MNSETTEQANMAVRALYENLLGAWNRADSRGFAALFEAQSVCVGFDGSTYTTAKEIETSLAAIFKDHQVARYVWLIRDAREIAPGTTLLRAEVGMVPPGGHEIKSERNAVQVLVASNRSGLWKIASFQNTPARYDGRPEKSKTLTEELMHELEKAG
jgi:uncharacterized protein (TIGR02246 family)